MKTPTDEQIEFMACEEMQQDWNDLQYGKVYKDGFIDGSKWMRKECENNSMSDEYFEKVIADKDKTIKMLEDALKKSNELAHKLAVRLRNNAIKKMRKENPELPDANPHECPRCNWQCDCGQSPCECKCE